MRIILAYCVFECVYMRTSKSSGERSVVIECDDVDSVADHAQTRTSQAFFLLSSAIALFNASNSCATQDRTLLQSLLSIDKCTRLGTSRARQIKHIVALLSLQHNGADPLVLPCSRCTLSNMNAACCVPLSSGLAKTR